MLRGRGRLRFSRDRFSYPSARSPPGISSRFLRRAGAPSPSPRLGGYSSNATSGLFAPTGHGI